METRNQNLEGSGPSGRKQHHGQSGLIFMAGVSLAFSTLGLLVSGFLAYQLFELQEDVGEVRNTLSQTARTLPNLASSAQTPVSQAPASTTGIQPAQLIQVGFDNTARIELLSVKRSQDSDVGKREFVNVQMRVHPLSETGGPMFWPRDTKARNSETGETYEAVTTETATSNFFIPRASVGALVDAHVWLRVPENVNTVDIFVPNTGVFEGVPISG